MNELPRMVQCAMMLCRTSGWAFRPCNRRFDRATLVEQLAGQRLRKDAQERSDRPVNQREFAFAS